MALIVEPGIDTQAVAEELAQEMEAIGDVTVERILGARDADDLAVRLAATTGPVVSAGLDGWQAAEWANLDRLRSRYAREERTGWCSAELHSIICCKRPLTFRAGWARAS